jgi:hypothetical protein
MAPAMADGIIGTTISNWTIDRVTEASSITGTSTLPATGSSSWVMPPPSSFNLYNYFAIIVSTIGIIANGFVSLLVIKSNRSSASATKVLIASQCLIDMFYSIGSFLAYFLKLIGLKHYRQPPTMSNIIVCVLFDSGTASAIFQNSSTAGLVAITLTGCWSCCYHSRTILQGRLPH